MITFVQYGVKAKLPKNRFKFFGGIFKYDTSKVIFKLELI